MNIADIQAPIVANQMLCAVTTFPKRNTRFKLEDFFQVEVDDFNNGYFLFLSAKKVKTKSDEKLMEDVESFDEYGWVISTWCYSCKYYYKIFVCNYKSKPWHNNYHIRSHLSAINGCDGFTATETIEEFISWMDLSQ